jgi:hypothetical protein
MKYKNAFWLSLVCGITLACSPALAQGAHQDAPPPPPNGALPGSSLPSLPPLNPEQRDAQRTISGPYRLTFTITEMDGSKKVNSQHYVVSGDADAPPTELKLGTKIPIETGASGAGALPPLSQITYIDIGLRINARLRKFANGLELSSNISQSAIDSRETTLKSPVIRQTSLVSTVLFAEDKLTTLGIMDELGTTHRLQIEVEVTRIR